MTKRERSRPDRPSMERSLDALLDRGWHDRGWLDRGWLDRDAVPDGDPARWQPVAQVLAALTSAPESSELTGQARALAEFRAFAEAPANGTGPRPPAPRRNPGWMTWRPARRPAVAAATGAVLMGGLLALAYAGDLPVAAQRLAHDTIHAPAARPGVAQPAGSPNPAGRAVHRATHASLEPDRRVHSGSVSGDQHRHGSSSSPSGSSSWRPGPGRQSWSGSPGRSAGPGPVQGPWPPASISPPASATPSPSAAPSPTQSGPPYPQQSQPQQSPSSSQSTPP